MNIHGIQSVGTLTQVSGGFATLTGSFTGSFVGDGSGLTGISASFSFDTSSLVTTASFNAYTQSVNSQLSALESATSSYAISSSVAAVDIAQDCKISSLIAATSSYATTGSNTFVGNQIVNADISASGNISASSLYATNATIVNLTTVYETSSVVYSSGSNQLGDALSDVQILSGSVEVVGGLTVNGVSVVTSSVDISSLNAFTASQIVSNSYFATTGSNSFVGNQVITGSVIISSSAAVDLEVSGNIRILATGVGQGLLMTSSTSDTQVTIAPTSIAVSSSATQNTATYGRNSFFQASGSSSGRTVIGMAVNPSQGGNGSATNPSIFVNYGTGVLNTAPIQFQPSQSYTDGRVTITTPLSASAGITSSDAFINGELYSVTSASFDSRLDVIGGNYATTGSNTFNGDQTINGNLIVTGSVTASSYGFNAGTLKYGYSFDASVTADTSSKTALGKDYLKIFQYQGQSHVFGTRITADQLNEYTGSKAFYGTTNGQLDATNVEYFSLISASVVTKPASGVINGMEYTTGSAINVVQPLLLQDLAYFDNVAIFSQSIEVSGSTYFGELTGSLGAFSQSVDNRLNNVTINTSSLATTGSNTFNGNQIVSGNVDISGNLSASLAEGYVWVGGAGNRTVVAATSSFGGASFPYTGSAIITGSLLVTGSQYGNVVALTVSSGTASLDFSLGNSFTLTLPSSSTTVIDATNIRAGQTVNLLITQQATTGAVSFTSEFKFQNGVDYQASASGSAIDLLSFATFDTTSVYATAIKNLY